MKYGQIIIYSNLVKNIYPNLAQEYHFCPYMEPYLPTFTTIYLYLA